MNSALVEVLTSVVALLAIMDPLGNVGIVVSITEGDTARVRSRQVWRGHLFAAILLMVFYFVGAQIMGFFDITIDAVRVAGGLILVKIGFDLLAMKEETRSTRAEQSADRRRKDIAFFPLAMPLVAGPGALTLVLTKSVDVSRGGLEGIVIDISAILIATAVSMGVLLSTGWFTRVLGVSGMAAVSRLMGFILVCISVQMVILGVKGVLAN